MSGRARDGLRARRRGGARAMAAAVLLAASAGCGTELFTGPEVELTGVEPGPAVYRASGAFAGLAYPATGRATYWIDGEGNAALELDADFSTPDLPERIVFLSNAQDLGDAVRVGRLEDGAGPARWTFRMPRGAVWRWVTVYSEGLGVAAARAELVPEG